MGLSLNVLRTGKHYRVTNFGETHFVAIEDILPEGVFLVKDLHTLERYALHDLYNAGKGKDFSIDEIRAGQK